MTSQANDFIRARAAEAEAAMKEHRYDAARDSLRAITDPRASVVCIKMMLLVTEHELAHARSQGAAAFR